MGYRHGNTFYSLTLLSFFFFFLFLHSHHIAQRKRAAVPIPKQLVFLRGISFFFFLWNGLSIVGEGTFFFFGLFCRTVQCSCIDSIIAIQFNWPQRNKERGDGVKRKKANGVQKNKSTKLCLRAMVSGSAKSSSSLSSFSTQIQRNSPREQGQDHYSLFIAHNMDGVGPWVRKWVLIVQVSKCLFCFQGQPIPFLLTRTNMFALVETRWKQKKREMCRRACVVCPWPWH